MPVLASRREGDGTVATPRASNAGQPLRLVRMTATIFAAREARERLPSGAALMNCLYFLSSP